MEFYFHNYYLYSKKLTKNKEISEDEERRLQEIIQKNTDTFIAELDSMIDIKEKDLLTI